MKTNSRIADIQQKFEAQHAGEFDLAKTNRQYADPETQARWDAFYLEEVGPQEDRAEDQAK